MNSNDVADKVELENDCTLTIMFDFDPESPREWDNLGTMVCFHRRMNLGDEHEFDSPDDFREWIKENPSIVLPLYIYEHGGVTMSTGGFSDPWDSGQVGWIYVTYEQIRKEYGWKYITSKRAKQIREYLKNEVETYDDYLTGQVYGFEVICNKCGESLDSCWGFYGYDWKKNGIKDHVGTPECDNCKRIRSEEEEIENRLAMVGSL